MFVRPKPGESEEDILAMQEAYLAEKERNKQLEPSAKVVNLRKHKTDAQKPLPSSPKQSKFEESGGLKKDSRVTFDENPTFLGDPTSNDPDTTRSIKDVEEDKVYFPQVLPCVMGAIVEKNTSDSRSLVDNNKPLSSLGFPEVRKIEKNVSSGSRSIFSQQKKLNVKIKVEKSSTDNVLQQNSTIQSEIKMEVCSSPIENSVIIQSKEAIEIHKENIALLESLSEKEILQEKERLTAMIDPKTLEFIKSLRNKKNIEPVTKEFKPKLEKPIVKKEIPVDLSENDVFMHPKFQSWIHFDTLEQDKLQWIKEMKPIDYLHTSDKPYEARFDFKGYLLPYSIEYTEETKTLFHHGEDPHRPGYSLSELFQLSRSTVTQQRALALITIAGILEYHNYGFYTGIIDIPITKIFFVLRFALDENISIVLEPTLKALRNMFYNKVDEACLDFLLGSENGLLQPRLLSKKLENEDTDSDISELKDFHLVDLDLISGAIRTDMLTRIRYILNTVKPTTFCVQYCLEILIRMTRSSLENAEVIFNSEGLLDCIFTNYIPKYFSNSTESQTLILCALKFVRVLVAQSKSIAERCYSEFKITDSLLNFIYNTELEKIISWKIQIEALYLWASLLSYGIGLSELMELKSALIKIVDIRIKSTDINTTCSSLVHSHVAALVSLLTNARLAASQFPDSNNSDLANDFDNFIVLAAQKWTSQVCIIEHFTAGHLKSLSAVFIYLNVAIQLNCDKVCSSVDVLNACLKKMIKSQGFSKVTSKMIESSNLLTDNRPNKSKKELSLPSLESSVIADRLNVLPSISSLSPMNFVSALSKYIYCSKNSDLSLCFIQQNNIFQYIRAISLSEHLSMADNWFSKMELDILCNCICFSAGLKFSDLEKELLYNFAFKLTYILSPEYGKQLEMILKKIVFNKTWFTTDRLLKNLNLSEAENILNHLDSIFQCYATVLRVNCKEEISSLTVSNWDQKILPRDWMFLPILGLYTKSQDPEDSKMPKDFLKTKEEIVKNIVVCSLEWILISELYFPEITNEIGLTDRFCRLSCVFLCDNSLFLDEDVKPLLKKCIQIIFNLENSLNSQNKLNFDKNLLGINNFQDLYTQLVDQFQAVSYGDPTFSACILVPLAQCHNIKWRKLVWSEYAACLRALDCSEDLLCYKMEKYLQPPELDFSLLKCYHRALISNLVRPCTIPYKIAQTHVEFAQNRQKAGKGQ